LCLVAGLASPQDSSETQTTIRLEDVAEKTGLDFQLNNFSSPTKHMIEPMTGGIGVFDYNNDGFQDIFFTNGAVIPSMKKESPDYHNRLYQNMGGKRFEEVTAKAGLQGEGYSMGAAVADYDNDGYVDLFVAGVYHNLLYHNRGDGTFELVTEKAGINSKYWSVAAGWFDYDNDGLLDLFVVNYVVWSPINERYCGDKARDIRVYCHPKYFKPVPNQLYRNKGDGTFENVTETSGIGAFPSKGMSIAFEDYDENGFLDAFVTNDNMPNSLFQNLGDGTFDEVALLVGVALREHGKPVASMGAEFKDYDNDGRPDIYVTALDGETFPLFRNMGDGFFEDATYVSELARQSIKKSAWSNGVADFDNDGWKDLFSANSHVNDLIELFEASVYRQPNAIYQNQANGKFKEVTALVGPDFQVPRGHRGSAFCDYDNDGKIDLIVTSIKEPTELFHNVSIDKNNWIIVKLQGTKSNRDGIGARVRVGNRYNIMSTARGYASSSHIGVHLGLGDTKHIDQLEIDWPSGTKQVLKDVAVNQILSVVEP
jgi:hypothetical protein